MKLDLVRFFQACNPSKTLVVSKPEDRQYYIDFSKVRGAKIIEELGRTITRLAPEEPTCQLFTGHIGCGKSTELLRLKAELEQQGLHVVYFESSQSLDMADIDVTDILLAVAREVSQSLEAIKINLKPGYFKNLFTEISEFLQTPLDIGVEAELSVGIAKITAKTKDSPKLRGQLRQYLEPRTNGILESINKELLKPAREKLKQQGKKGLVVIIDNLDRVDNSQKPSGHYQPEYLFVERGEQLNQLNCHVVYTIPLVLIFSNALGRLTNRFGVDPKVTSAGAISASAGAISASAGAISTSAGAISTSAGAISTSAGAISTSAGAVSVVIFTTTAFTTSRNRSSSFLPPCLLPPASKPVALYFMQKKTAVCYE
ncbi:P-loop NTPase fold protein [Nostoc sp.]|uniref:P-loop NTPase fold protein n=1 Tax=Nostoc sp. TaxID=1180 RepID=UPI002FF7FA0A